MCKSFKSGFDFVVKIIDDGTDAKMLRLRRSNGSNCWCPWDESEAYCGSQCPHFVVDNCDIVNKKCTIVLTCGRHLQRVVEIV